MEEPLKSWCIYRRCRWINGGQYTPFAEPIYACFAANLPSRSVKRDLDG